MLLSSFFKQLSFGELSGIAMGMEGAGTIQAADQDMLVTYTNEVLTELYTKYIHSTQYASITLDVARTVYPIRAVHNVSDTDVGNTEDRFINDTVANPFLGGILKIISVTEAVDTDMNGTRNLLLNDTSSTLSIKTVTYDQLYIQAPVTDIELIVECQMAHPALSVPYVGTEDIVLNPLLFAALRAKVASKVFFAMNGEENSIKSKRLGDEYDRILDMVKLEDTMQQSSSSDNSNFYIRGWV